MDDMKLEIDTIKSEMLKHLDHLQEDYDALLERYNSVVLEKNELNTELNKVNLEKDKVVIELNQTISERDKTSAELEKSSAQNDELESKIVSFEAEVEKLSTQVSTQTANNSLLDEKLSRVSQERDLYFQNSQKIEAEKLKLADDNKAQAEKIEELLIVAEKHAQLELEREKLIANNENLASELDELTKTSAENTAREDTLKGFIDEFRSKVDKLYGINVSMANTPITKKQLKSSEEYQQEISELEKKLEEAENDLSSCLKEIEEAEQNLNAETGVEEREQLADNILELGTLKESWEKEIEKLKADIDKLKNEALESVVAEADEYDSENASNTDESDDNASEVSVISVAEKKLLKSIQYRDLLNKRLDEAKKELRNEYGFEKIQSLKSEIKDLEDKKSAEEERISELEEEIALASASDEANS